MILIDTINVKNVDLTPFRREYKEGSIRFTHPVDNPLPIEAYLSLIGKYQHLDDQQIAYIQEQTKRRIEMLKNFEREGREEAVSDAA